MFLFKKYRKNLIVPRFLFVQGIIFANVIYSFKALSFFYNVKTSAGLKLAEVLIFSVYALCLIWLYQQNGEKVQILLFRRAKRAFNQFKIALK